MKYNVKHLTDNKYRKITQVISIIIEGGEKYKLEVAFMCLWGCTEEYQIPEYSNYWNGLTKQNLKLDIEMVENVDKRIYEIINFES